MRPVRAIYRHESDGAWIGTSPDVPGYVAHGDSYEEARDRMDVGLPWFAEERLLIAHVVFPDDDSQAATTGPRVSFAISRAPASNYQQMPLEPTL